MYTQLVVSLNVLVKFSQTEAFQLHRKFRFIRALKNVIVRNWRSTGVMNYHALPKCDSEQVCKDLHG